MSKKEGFVNYVDIMVKVMAVNGVDMIAFKGNKLEALKSYMKDTGLTIEELEIVTLIDVNKEIEINNIDDIGEITTIKDIILENIKYINNNDYMVILSTEN